MRDLYNKPNLENMYYHLIMTYKKNLKRVSKHKISS